MKRILLPLLLIALPLAQGWSYDIVNRAKLLDDQMKTMEMLNPYGHDFYLGVNAALTTDITDLLDEVEDIGDRDGDGDEDTDDVNIALRPFYNKEQAVRAKIDIGIPLPSFTAYNINFTPDFYINGGLTTMLMPTTEMTNLSTVIANLDQIPADLRDTLQDCIVDLQNDPTILTDGADLLQYFVDGTDSTDGSNVTGGQCISQDDADLIKDQYSVDTIPYNQDIAKTAKEVPVLYAYAKIEAKTGVKFNYETEDKHFFGHLAINALGRLDIYKYADSSLLLGGGGDMSIEDNSLINLTLDYKIGYHNTNYSVFTSIEDVKVAEMSSTEGKSLAFGTDPLIRIHAQADYHPWDFVTLSPFVGSHTRSGYGLDDAYYIGADWGMHVWKDRFGLTLRTMLDKEHLTLGFRGKLWIFQTDLMAKIAIKDNIDGIKVNELYTANIRFFF